MDHTLRCPTCLVDWVFTSDELRRLLIGQDIDGDALVEIESDDGETGFGEGAHEGEADVSESDDPDDGGIVSDLAF